jgi:hypothetical protein
LRKGKGGRRKEEGGRRKEEGGRRKEKGGRRKENGEEAVILETFSWRSYKHDNQRYKAVQLSGKAMNRKQKAAREDKLIQACPGCPNRGSSSAAISLAEAVRSG